MQTHPTTQFSPGLLTYLTRVFSFPSFSDRPMVKKRLACRKTGQAMVRWAMGQLNSEELISLAADPNESNDLDIANETAMMHQLYSLFGGKVAEQLIFNECSVETLRDLAKAKGIAYKITAAHGINDRYGATSFRIESGELKAAPFKAYSEASAKLLASKTQKLLSEAFAKATTILIARQDELKILMDTLLEEGYLDETDFRNLFWFGNQRLN